MVNMFSKRLSRSLLGSLVIEGVGSKSQFGYWIWHESHRSGALRPLPNTAWWHYFVELCVCVFVYPEVCVSLCVYLCVERLGLYFYCVCASWNPRAVSAFTTFSPVQLLSRCICFAGRWRLPWRADCKISCITSVAAPVLSACRVHCCWRIQLGLLPLLGQCPTTTARFAALVIMFSNLNEALRAAKRG